MGTIEFVTIAAVIAIVVVLAARIWRGDRDRDRGPMSSAMAIRGDLAALGGTVNETGHHHDHGHGHDDHGHDHGEHGHDDNHDADAGGHGRA